MTKNELFYPSFLRTDFFCKGRDNRKICNMHCKSGNSSEYIIFLNYRQERKIN